MLRFTSNRSFTELSTLGKNLNKMLRALCSGNWRYLRSASVIFLSASFLSACGSTQVPQSAVVEQAFPVGQRLDTQCVEQVKAREKGIQSSESHAQYLALANQAQRCLQGIRFFAQHPDNQEAMRLNALSVVNFIKGGDLDAANRSLTRFKQRFAQQDLVFEDYTSFIDTATAMLNPDLNARQLAMLNINPVLRNELSRTRQWSMQ
uniref:hypothetical protein n=1 Tax=Ningiella ruwaisensis TaxID=2364274 RepID=UPI0010A02B3B|nr:hypothetical protein [Ningiella ruwaisensis]